MSNKYLEKIAATYTEADMDSVHKSYREYDKIRQNAHEDSMRNLFAKRHAENAASDLRIKNLKIRGGLAALGLAGAAGAAGYAYGNRKNK